MLIITLHNVEDIIFYDKSVQQLFPDFRDLFHSWSISKIVPSLHHMGKKSLIEFLEQVKEEHIQLLEKHFETKVKIVPIDVHLIKKYEFDLEESSDKLNEMQLEGNYFIWRDANKLYFSLWR